MYGAGRTVIFKYLEVKEMKRINVLGTDYKLMESTEAEDEGLKGNDGYCDTSTKE